MKERKTAFFMDMSKAMLILTALVFGASHTFGGIIVSRAASFPGAPELPILESPSNADGVALKDSRQLTQTFQVFTGITIDTFYIDTIGLNNITNENFTVSIFTVADTNLGAPSAVPTGTNLLTTTGEISVSGGSGDVLEFSLTGADAIFLAANTGTAGYALKLNNTSGTGAFNWQINQSGDGTSGGTVGSDQYAFGQAYGTVLGGGFNHGNSDFTLVFTGTEIPEPSTAILAALGLAGICMRRRK